MQSFNMPSEDASSRARSSKSSGPARTISDAARQAQKATKPLVDAGVQALGGSESMNKTLKDWNPTAYAYIKDTYATPDPAKHIFMMVPIMLLTSMLPVLGPPLAMLSSIASAHFMLITGKATLTASMTSDPTRAKPAASLPSSLTLFLVIGLLQILPSFVLDVKYHFTAMWTVIVPAILTTRIPTGKRETVAEVIANTVLAPVHRMLKDALPAALVKPGKHPEIAEILVFGAAVVLMLHVGIISGMAGYLLIWVFAAKATLKTLSETRDENPLLKVEQIDLLAFWVLSWFLSVIETLPFISDSLFYHVPSYYMWKTIGMSVMMAMRSNERGKQAFYTEFFFGPPKPSRTSSSSSSSKPSSSSRSA